LPTVENGAAAAFGIQIFMRIPVNPEPKPPTFTDDEVKKQIVNDSLGTTDSADSTGTDETKETGDAKAGNTNSRED